MAKKKSTKTTSSKKKSFSHHATSARTKAENTIKTLPQDVWCAALAYVVVGLLWFAVDSHMQKNDLVKSHVKQALVIIVVGALLSIVSAIFMPLSFIPFVGIVFAILLAIVGLGQIMLLVFTIIGIVNAFLRRKYHLPVVGYVSKQLKF